MLALLAGAVLAAGGYDAGHELCALQGRVVAESSGVVAGARSDLLFTHNDSGDTARFFAVDRTCRTRATYALKGVQARDWEDVSRGPGQTLWFGDIGDNRETRDQGVLVHRVAEPVLGSPTQLTPTTYRLRYEDGPHDAEALLVTPTTGRVLVVTKSLGSRAGVYAADLPLRPGGVVNTLRLVAAAQVSLVTGGDISPDGTRVVLRNYSAAYEWDVAGGDVVAAFSGEPVRTPLPASQQGEGISYDRDGRGLITTSEGVGSPVFLLRRDGSASPGGASPAATAPGRVSRWEGWRVPLPLVGLAALVLLVAGISRAFRRGRR